MPKHPKSPKSKGKFAAHNSNSFFKPSKSEPQGQHCVQNIEIHIEQPIREDVLTGVVKALGSIFKKGG